MVAKQIAPDTDGYTFAYFGPVLLGPEPNVGSLNGYDVSIRGKNLGEDYKVMMDGEPVEFAVMSDNQFRVVVPAGFASEHVFTVITSSEVLTNSVSVGYIEPTVLGATSLREGVEVKSEETKHTVTIAGTNFWSTLIEFDSPVDHVSAIINDVECVIKSVEPTAIVCDLPIETAIDAPNTMVSVDVGGRVAKRKLAFGIEEFVGENLPAIITSITATAGAVEGTTHFVIEVEDWESLKPTDVTVSLGDVLCGDVSTTDHVVTCDILTSEIPVKGSELNVTVTNDELQSAEGTVAYSAFLK